MVEFRWINKIGGKYLKGFYLKQGRQDNEYKLKRGNI